MASKKYKTSALALGEMYEKLYQEKPKEYEVEVNPLSERLEQMTIDQIADQGERLGLTFQWYEGKAPFFVAWKNGITEDSENWKVYANEVLRRKV